MTIATVIGFGGRAPPVVLDLLAKAVAEWGLTSIIPERSPSVNRALLSPPRRVFMTTTVSSTKTEKISRKISLLFYCLPSSIAEYLKFHEETNKARSALLDVSNLVVVVIYDPVTDSMVGADNHILATDNLSATLKMALEGNVAARSTLAAAALTALSKLDQIILSRYWGDQQHRGRGGGVGGDVVLVVGSGGREHALAVTLAESPLVGKVVCCPGNGGTASEGGKITNAPPGTGQDNASVIKLVQDWDAQMVVVGPEAPLVDGLVDALAIQCPGVMVFGPQKAAAELEASKAFSKDFLHANEIPTANYRTFTDVADAIAYVNTLDENDRQVVKASGLAAGKGVLLPTSKEETIAAIKEVMLDKAFGTAGDVCVIESYLTGQEASCLAFCDGKTAVLMPAAQDHKRALDHDEGLNTGGMGAYAPAPCVTPVLHKVIQDMCIKTVQKMAERGTPYIGVLYAGMMLTPTGPQILEFNCRFGDPETQVILPLLETDLYEVLTACCVGKLDTVDVRFREGASAATVVCAAKGYPGSYPKGMLVMGLHGAGLLENVKVFHAGTIVDEQGETRCCGGRVLAVTGVGNTLKDALQSAYQGVTKIDFLGPNNDTLMHYRKDIARRAVDKKLRIGVLGSTRGTACVPVIEACASGRIHAEIVAVISNKSTAPILEKGKALGASVVTKFISAKGLSREEYDAECTAALIDAGVEFVLLVGYMRILSKPFTDYWNGRCINVHPSLLPKHAGGMDLAVHQAVIDAGEEKSGCTIHQVTETVDDGPIVVQKTVKVSIDDTAESLKAKVQKLEGVAFIEAIDIYCKRDIISYASAGVNIDAGNELVDLIKPACKATRRPGCDAELGGFGALFDLAAAGYDSSTTVLIGATDGVGTKLRIAQATGKHETVGIDLVAMCVNDLIVAGGEPLFFLDYYAAGHLEVHEASSVIRGIAEGCKLAGCGLIGGETAEMPLMYAPGDYDLAGFSVGAVLREKILPRDVSEGDVILGLPSSGIHSNGFSLVRRLVEKEGLEYGGPCPWDLEAETLGDALLTPTKIYVSSCLPLIKRGLVKGMAHITGGGLLENVPRSLPPGIGALITSHPPLPPVFSWIQRISGLEDTEMLRTFNCGVGMVLIVNHKDVKDVKTELLSNGEHNVYDLGVLVKGAGVQVPSQLVCLSHQ